MLILCAYYPLMRIFCAVGLLCAVTTYAQKMHMCADTAPSACIMRGCVFCADYAQMRIMRIYACALLRIMPYAVMRIISVRTFAYYAQPSEQPHAGPHRGGSADFPCLRQLPPPPELQCGHELRRRGLRRHERRHNMHAHIIRTRA